MKRLNREVYAVEPTQPDEGKRAQGRPPKPKPAPEPPKYAPDDPRARYPMRYAQACHDAEMQHHARDDVYAVIWLDLEGFKVVSAGSVARWQQLYRSTGKTTRECERHLSKRGR